MIANGPQIMGIALMYLILLIYMTARKLHHIFFSITDMTLESKVNVTYTKIRLSVLFIHLSKLINQHFINSFYSD